jgi:hypothetical protein
MTHTQPELVADAIVRAPGVNREQIRRAQSVANPAVIRRRATRLPSSAGARGRRRSAPGR